MGKNTTTLFKTELAGYAITLEVSSSNRYTVRYGLQVWTSLAYARAASELGSALLHAAQLVRISDE